MKLKFNLIIFIVSTFLLFSCEENKNIQFDSVNGTTLYAFDTKNVKVDIKDTTGEGEVKVLLNTTTTSSSDRTLTLSIDKDKSDAEDSQFSFNSTVTIPAGEFSGVLNIKGFKSGNIELGVAKKIVLSITNASTPGILSKDSLTVDLVLYCDSPTPLGDDLFVGKYLIEQTSDLVDGPTLSNGTIVELKKVDSNTREFATETYPKYCSGSFMNFQIQFVCDQIIVPNQDTICRCKDVTDWFTPANKPTSYDITNDKVFFVTFTDDTQSDCGSPVQTTYKFTKQ